jgi:hypothetical protein
VSRRCEIIFFSTPFLKSNFSESINVSGLNFVLRLNMVVKLYKSERMMQLKGDEDIEIKHFAKSER